MTGPARPGLVVLRRALVALGLAAAAAVLSADPAAACNAGRHAKAHTTAGQVGRAPLAVGDSTMILAAPRLGRLGIEADARGCRQFGAGVALLAQRRRAGTLPAVVVLALGANGAVGPGQIGSALRVVGRHRILVLVTPRNSGVSGARMWAAARAHPDRVLVVDWTGHSAGHPGWFGGDGLHVGYNGADAFARLVRRRIAPFAFPPVRRLKVPRRPGAAKACGTVRRGGRRLRVYVVRGRTRVVCRSARRVARRSPLRPGASWRAYDWRRVPRSTWAWLYRRHDGRVVVGVAPVARPAAAQ